MKLRKILSSALATATLLSAAVFPASAADGMPFDDVKSGDWFYGAVKFVYDDGIMKGIDSDVFSPSGNLTRAEFVTILCRMSDGKEKITNTFTDVPSGEWYSGYVGWGAEAGVVNGYEDNTFRPNAPMSRQEMAAAMVRYIGARDINLPRENSAPYEFTDNDSIDEWAADYIDVLRISGIVAGDDGVNYNPQDNISRAEAATIIERLYGVVGKAWQGYIPSSDDEKIILGAKYLYWGGTVVAGGLETELRDDSSFAYPALEAFASTPTIEAFASTEAGAKTYLPMNTVGISFNVIGQEFAAYPVAKICYKYESSSSGAPAAKLYNAGKAIGDAAVADGEADDGWKTAIVDFSSVLASNKDIDDKTTLTQLLFEPFSEKDGGDARFLIRYIGLFKGKDAAESFKSADMDDYLKNYFVYSNLDYEEISDVKRDEYEKKLVDRVNEILNSSSELTPEQITAAGGKCYYVSSIHGSDSNDGSSPNKAWKSLSSLYYQRGPLTLCHARPGDGVFFERGSEFYPEIYKTNTKFTLTLEPGVSYGAYGNGDKPLFTGALDFRDQHNGAGNWIKTEWNNIYVLEEIDSNPDFCGERAEVGMIVFNKGEATGVRVIPADNEEPFGEGKIAGSRGFCTTNGEVCYESGAKSCENPGTALTNDLEFLHDYKNGKLYLYSTYGNPSDRFDDVKVCCKNYAITGENTSDKISVIDNLSAMYSAWQTLDAAGSNLLITNCESGFCSGDLAEVEGGIASFGAAKNVTIRNCYVHDIGDGAVTHQATSWEEGDPVVIEDILYENNVFVGTEGVETWNNMGPIDENGVAQNYLKNVVARGNIIAYSGYGIMQKEGSSRYSGGGAVNSSVYGQFYDCLFEDNLVLYSTTHVFAAYLYADNQKNGWQLRNNTYVINPDASNFLYMYETEPFLCNHNMDKHNRINIPYNERYMTFLTSCGVEPGGKFYYFTGLNAFEKKGIFYTNGYLVSKGILPD